MYTLSVDELELNIISIHNKFEPTSICYATAPILSERQDDDSPLFLPVSQGATTNPDTQKIRILAPKDADKLSL